MLDEHIAPSLAAHGGMVQALGIDQGQLVVKFGGGCQGCSQVSSTVKFGVEKVIMEHFPQVKGVVDVTEHRDGTNPYFT